MRDNFFFRLSIRKTIYIEEYLARGNVGEIESKMHTSKRDFSQSNNTNTFDAAQIGNCSVFTFYNEELKLDV